MSHFSILGLFNLLFLLQTQEGIMEHARFIQHAGKDIFVLDFTNKKPDEALVLIDECARQVRSRPNGSVRTLTLVSGGTFSQDVLSGLKELTKGNAPHVCTAALVGVTGLYKVALQAVSLFSKRQFFMFDCKNEALDFLAQN
jgi:hypothetical protein